MEWSEKVEEMLQKSLKLEKELKNFKTTNLDKLKEESHQFDECLNASSTELKRLQEESDGLLAQMGGSLTHLRDALMIKNDPDRQFLTPPVTFTLDNFRARKDNNEFWLSPYFYSHRYGYQMQLKVFPNGIGEGAGTHISMFILIVPGEFDDLLTWPFCGIITVHLINQHKNGLNVVHKVNYTTVDNLCYRERPLHDVDDTNRMGWGTFKLITHAELGERAGLLAERVYLKNNFYHFVFGISQYSLSIINSLS